MPRRKRKPEDKQIACNVCEIFSSTSSSPIPRCATCVSSLRCAICDSCLYKHILTSISQDITKDVICPNEKCSAKLTKETIQIALVAFGKQDLWNDYLLKHTWRGTSEEWIRCFGARCPRCRIPIEKNGGCDHMVCKLCRFQFSWNQVKNSKGFNIQLWWRVNARRIAMTFLLFSVIFVSFFIGMFCVYLMYRN